MAFAQKATESVKTLVPPQVLEDLQKFTRENGYGSVSDCVREALMVMLYGEEQMQSLHAQRIKALARNMAGIGPDAA